MTGTLEQKSFKGFTRLKQTLANLFNYQRMSDVLLLLLWLLALLVVSPFGDFPVNDDWAYAKNVRSLAVDGKFVLDTFPAMNLISQTVYASIFVKCFGFSFVTLRMSIFFLCLFSSFVLKRLVQSLVNSNQWFSFFFVCVFFFNPIVLELSFTFMTDMFFISMLIFAIYFLVAYHRNNKPIHYFLFVVLCILAVLCRQHGLLFSFMSLLLLNGNKKKVIRFVLALLPPLLTWLAHDKYRHFLAEYHIANGINYSDRLIKHIATAPIRDYLIKAGDIMIVTGLLLLPIVMLLLFSENFKNRKILVGTIPLLFIVAYPVYYMWDLYPVGNITTVLHCGPRLVKIDSPEKFKGWLEMLRQMQVLFGGISLLITLVLISIRRGALSKMHSSLALIFGLIAILFFVFITISEAYFDRYTIPLVLLLAFLLFPGGSFSFSKGARVVAVSITVLLYSVAIAEVRDYFKWQEIRWEALNELNSKGITPEQIDGGFEYNAWYKPTNLQSKNGKSWWWVKDDAFVVSMQRLKNYEVEKVYTFKRLIPIGTDSIYVLKRN